MKEFCPNKTSKEFKELSNIFGEDKAYLLWMRNKGNELDKAPNGALSKLFWTLLNHFNGNREEALKAKAKVYSDDFFNWFGKWTEEDKNNVSKVVDENGEPLVVYHGSNSYGFNVFDPSRSDDKISIFASNSEYIASTYVDFLKIYSDLLKLKLQELNTINAIKNKDWDKLKRIINSIYDETVDRDRLIYESGSYGIYQYLSEAKDITEEEYYELLSEASDIEEEVKHKYTLRVKQIRDKIFLTISDSSLEGMGRFRDSSIIFYGTPEQLIESSTFDTKIYNLFANIKNPLILSNQNNEFGASLNWNNLDFSIVGVDVDDLNVWGEKTGRKKRITRTRDVSKYAKDNGYDGVIFEGIVDRGGYRGDIMLDPYSDSDAVYDYFHEGEDSYRGNNIYASNIYVSFNSILLKSATSNKQNIITGERGFSNEDPNIYYSQSEGTQAEIYEEAKEYENRINSKLSSINWLKVSENDRAKIKNDYKKEFDSKFKHRRLLFGYNRDTQRLQVYSKSRDKAAISDWMGILSDLDTSKRVRPDDLLKVLEHLAAEVHGTSYHMSLVVSVLKQALKGKTIAFLFTSKLPDNVGARYDSFSNTILINTRAAFANDNGYKDFLAQTVLHELLHAVTVQTIQHSPELTAELENLLKVVRKALGEEAKDYGLTDIYEFLAELSNENFVRKLIQIETKSEAKNYVSEQGIFARVREFIRKVINQALRFVNQKHRGTAYADAVELLLKSVFPEDFNIELQQQSLDDKTEFDITSQQKAQHVSEKITKRFYTLYRAYEKLPNKSPRRQKLQNEIFETFNKLKQLLDYRAVGAALDFALQNLGMWDYVTNRPMKIDSVSGYLWKLMNESEPFKDVNPDRLVEMWKNSIGFYDDLLSNYIPDNLDEQMSAEDRQKVAQLKTLIDTVIKPMWLRAMATVGDRIVDEIIDREVSASNEDKENMKIVAKDWLHKNIMYGDINVVSSYIFNNSYSSNPIIKQAFHLIQDAETKTLEEVHPIGIRITKAYQKANGMFGKIGPNWLTILMEFDRNGVPTGKFVRPINYGLYELDLTKFVEDLNKEFENTYGHTYIEDDTGVVTNSLTGELADDEEWGPNGEEPTYIKYLKRIEEFKCDHANRRYTINYYKERMSRPYKGSVDPNEVDVNKYGHGLSPRTLARYNYIQSNINYYLDLCTDEDTGFSRPEKLNPQDKKKLDDWYNELDDLQNPYNEDGTLKMDDDRQMAFEIRAWQKWLGEKLSTNIDIDKFNEEYTKVEEEAVSSGNYSLIHDFFKYNSKLGINPEFIELTIGKFPPVIDTEQAAIHAKLIKKALQSLVKTQKGYTRDLQKMENCPSFWLDCKHTDQLIEDNRTSRSKEFAEEFAENFTQQLILYRDSYGCAIDSNGNQVKPEDEGMHNDLLTYREYLINKYTNLAIASPSRTILGLNDLSGNPIVFNGTIDEVKSVMSKLFSYQVEYVDEDGEVNTEYVPLSIFSMLIPKKDIFFNTRTGRNEKTMIFVPRGRFAEKSDKTGMYINHDYVTSQNISEQPKKDLYDNSKAYEEMADNEATFELYKTLIEVMKDMQKNYQSLSRRFNYDLPQIEGHTMQLWSRIVKNGGGNTLQALNESRRDVLENDEAMRTTDDYVTNPDGSIATDIPLKFIRKLKRPENITTDIAGSVILFANMAINYKNKTEIDGLLKTLRYNLDFKNRKDLYKSTSKEDPEELAPYDNEHSIEMFDSMLNKHVYGNQWSTNPNQPDATQQGEAVNPLRNMINSSLIGTTSFAATGALFGLPFGMPAAGAIIGGVAGATVGTLNGLILSGLLNGVPFFKTIKFIQRLETTQTLALNIFSMLVGFGDSSTRIFKESLMGKYMTIRDTITSFGYVLWQTPRCIANMGNPLPNNKLTKMMRINGISKGVHQSYEHLNYGRFRRIVSNLLMGGFSLLDWMANALLMRAFYNNVRFYNGDKVPKGFYSKYELELAFVNAGYSKLLARLAHEMTNTTLWGAYDRLGNVKSDYKDYVTQRIKTQVRTKTLKRSALYNGMNPDNDIPRWKQDLIGSIVGALRAWLAQATQHLIAGGTDNIVRTVDTDKLKSVSGTKTKGHTQRVRTPLTGEQMSKRFAWDYETGTPLDLILVALFRSFKTLGKKLLNLAFLNFAEYKNTKFSLVEKYAWKDAIIYLAILGAMMYGWTFVNDWASDVPVPKERKQAAPESLNPLNVYQYVKDAYIPNEYYKLQISNIGFRIIEALITSIDPSSAMDVVNSVTALKNGIEEHLGVLKPIGDITGASGHTLDEINKLGGYKFYTRGERAAYKFIGPLDNLHTAFTYYGITENMKFYTNTYGQIYRFFGYDFKKEQPKSGKKTKTNDSGFGDNSGFGGSGFGGDSGF